jgi:hypothetical protein
VRQRGAVVEAAAAAPLGAPSVALLVEPAGGVRIVATLEALHGAPYRVAGHSFPQACVVPSAVADAAMAIGKELAAASFIGALDPTLRESHGTDGCMVLGPLQLGEVVDLTQ